MSTDSIIKKELYRFTKQKLNESNLYGFPEGAVDSGKVVTGGDGGNWGGSMDRALSIANLAKKCLGKDNVISSQKRSRVKTAAGNVSDHYKGNTAAYAVDLPVKGKAGDELLACIMKSWDNGSHSDYKGGKWLNINKDGYRYQFGWKVKGHFDHIHVGVKRKGGSSSSQDEKPDEDEDLNVTQPIKEPEKKDPKKEKNDDPYNISAGLKGLKGLTNFLLGVEEPEQTDDNKTDSDEEIDDDEENDTEEENTSSSSIPVVDIKDFKITEPSSEDKNFYVEVLKKIGAPVSKQNLLFFYAWSQAEGAKSTFNPFATTQKKGESTFFNCLKRKGGKCVGGVQNFKTKQDGIDATAKTITNGRYKCIVDGLKSDKGAIEISKCSDLNTWAGEGHGDYVFKVLDKKSVKPREISKTIVKSVNESVEQEKERILEIFKQIL